MSVGDNRNIDIFISVSSVTCFPLLTSSLSLSPELNPGPAESTSGIWATQLKQ